jgi:hypothetical protein
MAQHVDKVIVTRRAGLKAKYGAVGYRRIREALRRLVIADQARGLRSQVLPLDDNRAMRALGGKPVDDPDDTAGLKDAVDAAANALTPHYLLLLGAPDVLGQQRLRNPTPDDDPDVPSDLPYACTAGASDDPGAFIGPTRVVGRLPDLPGASDPAYLLGLLSNARRWRGRAAAEHLPVFAVSASIWKGSTEQSVRQLAGTGSGVHLSPPEDSFWPAELFGRRMHFVNCHGDEADFRWYGDDGSVQPVAVDGTRLGGTVTADTVVAAECCFGAAHYDPAVGGQPTVAATFLGEGASGVFGASTLAYGDSERTTSADLITRFFLSAVLEGASLGRAALQARLRFVQELGELDPYDLKTVVQFDLLGDPSAHPVLAATTPETPAPRAAPRGAALAASPVPPRAAARRRALLALGEALAVTVPRSAPDPSAAEVDVPQLARDLGVPPPPEPVARRYALRPPAVAAGLAAREVTYTVLASRPAADRRMALVVREEPGQPVTYRTVHSR